MRRAAALAVLVLTAGLLTLAAPVLAAPPRQTTVHDIEDEVMCPICGTLLELADSPQAKREKVYVAKLVVAGKTKTEVKDALVAQYGPSVLALPKASGFDLSAYLVPIVALAIAAVALAFSVARWRRDGGGSSSGEDAPPAPRGEDAERLETDLGRYDL
ncbi:MAG TPA: cytochrome c-type biogenesis protein CcmH [Solirubrobacterales bacterium]|jgi:cytochrome c-type biogenesis protein CcmH/NrfF|nr:cytochrome c-type biogenesis protein CcmH [Solirubrobacterales bacterium]